MTRRAGASFEAALLASNIFDAEWDEPAEDLRVLTTFFERGGAKIAVIGQAFPYMPIANPGWMFPEYSFGIRDERHAARCVDEVRTQGGRRPGGPAFQPQRLRRGPQDGLRWSTGIDIILSGHTHDALPEFRVLVERARY